MTNLYKGGFYMGFFIFNQAESPLEIVLVWLAVFVALFLLNELCRKDKYAGLVFLVALPAALSVLWFTLLKESTYTDWFHLAKVYSATAGCIGFWCIRHVGGTNKKTGKEWRLSDNRIALCFPPLILAVNIAEAVVRDVQVGRTYAIMAQDASSFAPALLMGGAWNYINALAGVINILLITGWFGICIRNKYAGDMGRDMLWPDMLWFYIVAYNFWNFAYTYNCLPHHAWYCGLALLAAPMLCAFTTGKGAWLQHRAQTLALWCMFAQTFPAFQDYGKWRVDSAYNPTIYLWVSLLALAANLAVFAYMIYRWKKTGRNPYKSELYSDMKAFRKIKALSE
jgi:hypothetical protein